MKTNKTFAYGSGMDAAVTNIEWSLRGKLRGLKSSWMMILILIALAFIACPADNTSNPQPKTYTVTFDADNGSEPTTQTVNEGNTANKPADPSKAYTPIGLYAGIPPTAFTFVEWQKSDGSAWNFTTDTITADITLTAQWTSPSPIDISNETGNNIVEKAVSYVNAHGGSEYTLVLGESVSDVAPQTLDQDDTTLTITSDGNIERKISLGENGSLFTVGGTGINNLRNAKLVIDGYITLEGKADNNASLLLVQLDGSLDLKGFAKITGNTFNYSGGGAHGGGGLNAAFASAITMSGNAEISGNSTNLTGSGSASGGGVLIQECTFTMNENASIKNNTASHYGGGVYVSINSIFNMNGGEISNNTAATGGGICVYGFGNESFVVANEQVKAGIHSNTAPTSPQVSVLGGTFTVGGEPADSF